MSKILDDLAKNNDHPSDKALLEVKELLSRPLKQLEETDAELSRLEKLIDELLEKRVEIEKSIDRYKCILSPVRRVPADILHTIFAHCLPTNRDPSMSASQAPMLLTRVCSSWREIALSSPRLWAQIYIPFNTESETHRGFVGQPITPVEEVVEILRLRCHAVKEWLSRSGTCPVSISVGFYQWHRNHIMPDRLDNSTILLFDNILLFSSRLMSLDLIIPSEVYYELDNMVSTNALPMLEELKVSVYPGDLPHARDIQQSLALLRSPNLNRISTNILRSGEESFCPWWKLPNAKLVPWHNITHLADHSYCSINDFFDLLKCCPQVVHCEFFIANAHVIDHEEDIHLPRLLSLSIKDTLFNLIGPHNIYNHIHAPQLRSIRYHTESNLDKIAADSMLLLVEKSMKLEELDIARTTLSPQTMLKFLQKPSQNCLTRLVLNWRDNPYSSERTPDPFDLTCLIANTDSQDVTTEKIVLLPRLQELVLCTTRATDDTVLKFVTSRMDPKSDIAVLRSVDVRFDRVKEKDGLNIAKEIHKRAETVGIDIFLDFSYLSPHPRHGSVDPLSPSFIARYPEMGWEDAWM